MNDHGDTYLNLLFFSVGGVHFAVEAEQVVEMTSYEEVVAGDLFWFNEELGFGTAAITYQTPTIVTITPSYRVIIDSMEDIVGFRKVDIHPFPELLEPFTLRKGLWGVVVKDDRMILLVDFIRLLRERRSADAHL